MYLTPGLFTLCVVSPSNSTFLPSTFSIWLIVIFPGLSITGTSPVQSKTVDSMPTLLFAPFKIKGIFPCISTKTSSAVVGLGRPLVLADGATKGTPHAEIKRLASLLSGILIATVLSPPVALSGTEDNFGKTIVILPGINASIIFCASGVTFNAS